MTTPTADALEIAKFNQLSQLWWALDGPMWPLHLLNAFRVQLILNVLANKGRIDRTQPQPLKGLTALDIGCGGGILSESLYKLGATVTGVDMAERNIQIAQAHAKEQDLHIEYQHKEVGSLTTQFDLVFNMEVVEHVADLRAFMTSSCDRLAQDGTMFLSTINRTIKSFLFAIVGAEYVLRLLPRGTHQWRKFVTPEELIAHLNCNGLDTAWSTGVALNPWSRRYRTTSSFDVNYLLAAERY